MWSLVDRAGVGSGGEEEGRGAAPPLHGAHHYVQKQDTYVSCFCTDQIAYRGSPGGSRGSPGGVFGGPRLPVPAPQAMMEAILEVQDAILEVRGTI